jgi:cytochrome c-type biogenesis protein CcmE
VKKYYIIAGIAIIAFAVLGVSSFLSAMTPYVTDFDEVRQSSRDKLQVPGDIIRSKTTYDGRLHALVFFLKDPAGQEMKVIYKGTKPAGFDQADKAVALGEYRSSAFYADEVRVKCPSKYQSR